MSFVFFSFFFVSLLNNAFTRSSELWDAIAKNFPKEPFPEVRSLANFAFAVLDTLQLHSSSPHHGQEDKPKSQR